jgi:epsilon-lactone hydrolase
MLRQVVLLLSTLVETIVARARHGRMLPSWGFQFEWMVRFLRRDFLEMADWPYPRLRADLDGRPYPGRSAAKVSQSSSTLGRVPVVTFTPPGAEHAGILLYFHGGSYNHGSPRTTHAELIARLALGVPVVVVAPEYRLAPEHPYPAALEDALAVFEALKSAHPSAPLLVAGDSAGGNLALALQLALRDRGHAQADAALLISPWLDLTASRASCRTNEPFDFGQTSFLLRHARDFAGRTPLDDPGVSPIRAELSKLAPMLVQVGGAERLHDECLDFAARAQKAKVQVELDVAPELPHLPPAFADYHPAAERALGKLIEYARGVYFTGRRQP